ncbi:MAG TPA: DUF1223 domain-containing protein [Candidatus Angelobacter sp.]
MIRFTTLMVLLLAAISVYIVLGKTTKASTPQKAVVVELFTSEGCSSCPPADELLGHLRQDLSAKNIQVIPLGFHVDYWNSLGWKDRFSSAEFSRRQERYAQSLGVDGPYTPQMVVDGAVQFVGSDSGQAKRAISQQASQQALAEVKISAAGTNQLAVQVKTPAAKKEGNVMLAITEDNLATQVGSGENGGRTLHHAAVVRELRQLGRLHEGSFEASIPLKLEKEWKREDLRAVVFVQEDAMGKIRGAASVALGSVALAGELR